MLDHSKFPVARIFVITPHENTTLSYPKRQIFQPPNTLNLVLKTFSSLKQYFGLKAYSFRHYGKKLKTLRNKKPFSYKKCQK